MKSDQVDIAWMERALDMAEHAAVIGEVPVGAVLIDRNGLLAASGNRPISHHDPTAHAEINVIRAGAAQLNNYRLTGTTLYVTLEPCLMCMGAIIHSRIERLVFGAYDPKTGAAVSRYHVGSDGLLNHSLQISGGLLQGRCEELLKTFFRSKRQ